MKIRTGYLTACYMRLLGEDGFVTECSDLIDNKRNHLTECFGFVQAKFYTDMPSETVSKIHLVDLAGRFVDRTIIPFYNLLRPRMRVFCLKK